MAQNKDDKPNDASENWEAVFSGKRLPNPEQKDEQTADQARQVLLWKQARQDTQQPKQQITPQQARAYYQYIHDLEQKRRPAAWLSTLKWLIPGLSLLGIGVGIGYYITLPSDPAEPDQTGVQIAEKVEKTSAPANTVNNTTPVTPTKPPGDFPELLNIPGGTYTMGCTPGWDDTLGGCRENEYPAHAVELPSFKLSRHEVTVGQFKQFAEASGYRTIAEQKQQGCAIEDADNKGQWIIDKTLSWRSPGIPQTDAHPVVCISWIDTQHYLNWLNEKTGAIHRLPTEEEWEYAARAGRITAYFWGSQPNRHFANYAGTGQTDQWQHTSPAGQFTSNPYGLHDMAGNAWEWTDSCWRKNYHDSSTEKQECISGTETLRTRRGGGWDNQPPSIRSAYRGYGSEVERSNVYGFRVASDTD